MKFIVVKEVKLMLKLFNFDHAAIYHVSMLFSHKRWPICNEKCKFCPETPQIEALCQPPHYQTPASTSYNKTYIKSYFDHHHLYNQAHLLRFIDLMLNSYKEKILFFHG